MFGPPVPELRACLAQDFHEVGEARVAGMSPGRGAELAEHRPSGRFPAAHAGAVDRVGEHHPEHVVPVRGERAGVVPDNRVGLVPHQVIEVLVIDRGQAGRLGIDQPLQPGQHVPGWHREFGWRQSCQFPQVPVLVVGQQQRPGERVDDLDRGGDVPALL